MAKSSKSAVSGPARNLYKRDFRRKYKDDSISVDKTIDELFDAPDEYIQSMYVAYPESALRQINPRQATIINGRYRYEHIGISPVGYYVSNDLVRNLAHSVYYQLRTINGALKIFTDMKEAFGADEHLCWDLYRMSTDEIKHLARRTSSNDVVRTMFDYQLARKYDKIDNVSLENCVDYVVDTLRCCGGETVDVFTQFLTDGNIESVKHYRRVVPASEEFGTPELVLYRL